MSVATDWKLIGTIATAVFFLFEIAKREEKETEQRTHQSHTTVIKQDLSNGGLFSFPVTSRSPHGNKKFSTVPTQ